MTVSSATKPASNAPSAAPDCPVRPPAGYAILRRMEKSEALRSGIVIREDTTLIPNFGEVLRLGGPDPLDGYETVAKVGDRVFFDAYHARELTLGGAVPTVLVLHQSEIVALLDERG